MKRLLLLPLVALVVGGAGEVNRREDACRGVSNETVTEFIFDGPHGSIGKVVSGYGFVPSSLQYYSDPPVWACRAFVSVLWQPSGHVAQGYLMVHHRPDGTVVATISNE